MSDKWIWHNCTRKDIEDWAKANKISETTLLEYNTQLHSDFCALLRVTTSSNINLICTAKQWSFECEGTLSLEASRSKVRIKYSDQNVLLENISSINCSAYSDIYEINFTERLKQDGYLWQDRNSSGELEGDPYSKLANVWFSEGDSNASDNNEKEKNSFKLKPLSVNSGDTIYYPFSSLVNCNVPNYNANQDGETFNLKGIIFNKALVSPLTYPAGQILGTPDNPYYAPGYTYDASVSFNGYIDNTKKANNWNMYLYPLVLLDSRNYTSNYTKQLTITTEGTQQYIILTINDIDVVKIPFNPNVDKIVKYTQSVKDVDVTLSSKSADGVIIGSHGLTVDEVQRVWYDSDDGCKKLRSHINLYTDLECTINYTNPQIYLWSDGTSLYPNGSGTWTEITKSGNSELFNIYSSIIYTGSISAINDRGRWTSAAKSVSGKYYNNEFKQVDGTEWYYNNRYCIGNTYYEFDPCCAGCGSAEPYVKFYLSTNIAKVGRTNVLALNKNSDYNKYLHSWFGDLDKYWSASALGFKKQPVVADGSISDHSATEWWNHDKIMNLQINLSLQNLNYSGNTAFDTKLYFKSSLFTYFKNIDAGKDLNIPTKGIVSITSDQKTDGIDTIVVLWTHNLDGLTIL